MLSKTFDVISRMLSSMVANPNIRRDVVSGFSVATSISESNIPLSVTTPLCICGIYRHDSIDSVVLCQVVL